MLEVVLNFLKNYVFSSIIFIVVYLIVVTVYNAIENRFLFSKLYSIKFIKKVLFRPYLLLINMLLIIEVLKVFIKQLGISINVLAFMILFIVFLFLYSIEDIVKVGQNIIGMKLYNKRIIQEGIFSEMFTLIIMSVTIIYMLIRK